MDSGGAGSCWSRASLPACLPVSQQLRSVLKRSEWDLSDLALKRPNPLQAQLRAGTLRGSFHPLVPGIQGAGTITSSHVGIQKGEKPKS